MTAGQFVGSMAQFKRFTGAYWRVVVQTIARKHKQAVGACEHCGTDQWPFDAAHIHGRERITLIHQLLGTADKSAEVEVDLAKFEADFRTEHDPVEKSILVLCKPCHTRYDASKPPAAAPETPEPIFGTENASALLPIRLEPPGEDAFKAALLMSKAALIDIHHRDGTVETKLWKAQQLTSDSRVMSNIRSRPDFRQGRWQELGIAVVHVRVADLP